MIEYIHKIKVYYKDVDQMGIVYYSRYLEYFEQARTELLSSIGLDVTNIEKEGIRLPVVTSHCDYKKGAHLEDNLRIKTSIFKTPRAKLKINYKVLSPDYNNLFAEGYTIHAFIKGNGKPTKIPSKILSKLTWAGNFS